jgi:hypothetical protein
MYRHTIPYVAVFVLIEYCRCIHTTLTHIVVLHRVDEGVTGAQEMARGAGSMTREQGALTSQRGGEQGAKGWEQGESTPYVTPRG